MGSLKSLALLALLVSLSLVVFADTSNDVTHEKDETKPSEATDTIEPQQPQPVEAKFEASNAVVEPQYKWRGGCRYGCCNWRFGRCTYCCKTSQDEAEAEAEVVEPEQGRGGRCRHGCCRYRYRRCVYCCRSPDQAEAKP